MFVALYYSYFVAVFSVALSCFHISRRLSRPTNCVYENVDVEKVNGLVLSPIQFLLNQHIRDCVGSKSAFILYFVPFASS